MRDFALLYNAIDSTNKTNEKVGAMVDYFHKAPPSDAIWAVNFLIGRRPKRLVKGPNLWGWARDEAKLPDWLFAESYDAVGDIAETISLVLPEEGSEPDNGSLTEWVEKRLLPLGGLPDEDQRREILRAWRELDRLGRFVYTKLITGAFRVGVSQDLVVRALSKASNVPGPVISHRLMGTWDPTPEFFLALTSEDEGDADVSKPYPFCLAHALENGPEGIGDPTDWSAEWKWDGIRAQVIRRNGQSFIWSRGEDLITDRFPEISEVCDSLPEGTVIDGELLAWQGDKPMKFLELQKRIGRKVLSKRILESVPVVLVAFDILEFEGRDVRECRFDERREMLAQVVELQASDRLKLAQPVRFDTWAELAEKREGSRDRNVEGVMLKRHDSPYLVGRKKGHWWKWKIDPMTVDCVLIYAQRGNGIRASLYSDYTFAVWSEDGKLVPFAKAYSGLTDQELRQVDSWIRRHTLEKFGPVRSVEQELVFELAFESIQLSTRHKSGVAVRFPRISRWRHDKKAADADHLSTIKQMLANL
jgi:DNA ligase-1